MNEKEILLELLSSLMDLRKSLKKRQAEKEEDKHSPMERKLVEDLKKDYIGFFTWALGLKAYDEGINHDEVTSKWKELHPELEVPRVALLREQPDSNLAIQLLIMDGYHLYLKHIEKE